MSSYKFGSSGSGILLSHDFKIDIFIKFDCSAWLENKKTTADEP